MPSPSAAVGVIGLTTRRRCAFATLKRSVQNRSAKAKEKKRRRGAVECILKVFRERLKAESAAACRRQSLAQRRARRSRVVCGTGGLCPPRARCCSCSAHRQSRSRSSQDG